MTGLKLFASCVPPQKEDIRFDCIHDGTSVKPWPSWRYGGRAWLNQASRPHPRFSEPPASTDFNKQQ